jgi:phage gpG-like protein
MGRRLSSAYKKAKRNKKKIFVAVVVLIAVTLAFKYGGHPSQWMGKARAFAEEGWYRTKGNATKFKKWARQFIHQVKTRQFARKMNAKSVKGFNMKKMPLHEVQKYGPIPGAKNLGRTGTIKASARSRKARKRKQSRKKRRSFRHV